MLFRERRTEAGGVFSGFSGTDWPTDAGRRRVRRVVRTAVAVSLLGSTAGDPRPTVGFGWELRRAPAFVLRGEGVNSRLSEEDRVRTGREAEERTAVVIAASQVLGTINSIVTELKSVKSFRLEV